MEVILYLIYAALLVLMLVAMWKLYEKANQPGWASLIPIYNAIVLLEMVKKPWWLLLFLFIPLVNLVVMILIWVRLAACFGKGAWFGIGLTFLGFIFVPILAFGDARYDASELKYEEYD